jgi:hypothetical protein
MSRPPRVAILTRSTSPCDVIVHALAAADTLIRISREAVAHAPDVSIDGRDRSIAAHPPVHRQLRELQHA